MSDLQYILTFSIFPVSGLVMAVLVVYLTRGDRKPLDDEGERKR